VWVHFSILVLISPSTASSHSVKTWSVSKERRQNILIYFYILNYSKFHYEFSII
jgi:hypothetical protein